MKYLILTIMACTYTLNGYSDENVSTPWVFLTKPKSCEHKKCERPEREKENKNDKKKRGKPKRLNVTFRENPRGKLGR